MRFFRTLSPADADPRRVRRVREPAMHIGGVSPRLADPSRYFDVA